MLLQLATQPATYIHTMQIICNLKTVRTASLSNKYILNYVNKNHEKKIMKIKIFSEKI